MFAAVTWLPRDVIIEDIWYSNIPLSPFLLFVYLLFSKFSYILFIFQLDWITFWLCTRVRIEIPKVHFSMKCLQPILCSLKIRGKDNNKVICSTTKSLFLDNFFQRNRTMLNVLVSIKIGIMENTKSWYIRNNCFNIYCIRLIQFDNWRWKCVLMARNRMTLLSVRLLELFILILSDIQYCHLINPPRHFDTCRFFH